MATNVRFNRKGVGILAMAVIFGITAIGSLATARENPPPTWEGMKRVDRPGLDAGYLRDGVSLAKYKKVMLDPVEVSFDKNWDPKPQGSVFGRGEVDPQRIRQ